jgi:hypothetical protein
MDWWSSWQCTRRARTSPERNSCKGYQWRKRGPKDIPYTDDGAGTKGHNETETIPWY